jgi:hypothetical protein
MGTDNYTVGMARFYFSAKTTPATRCDVIATRIKHGIGNCATWDMGNVVTSEITPDITYLDHYISYAGDRRKDKTVAVTKSLNIPITFDEFSATNLEIFFGATGTGGTSAKRVMAADTMPIEGAGVLVFWTDIGRDFMYIIPKCVIRTEGAALSFNAEDWSNLPMQIEVLHQSTYYPMSKNAASLAPYGYLDLTATSAVAPGV